MDTNLKTVIDRAINIQDSSDAIQVLSMLKKDPAQEIDHGLLLQLQYIRMNSLSPFKLLELMKESILVAYAIPDFDLGEKLKTYIDLMDDTVGEIKFMKDIINLFQSSEEILGSKSISINGSSDKPTIANWVRDYLTIHTEDGVKNAFTQLQYINTSENVKILNEAEKNVLKSLLKFNDYCIDVVERWENIAVPKTDKEAFQDYDLYQFIPGVEIDKDSNDPDVVVTEYPTLDAVNKTAINNPPLHKPIPQDLEYIAPAEPKEQHLPPPKNPVHLTDSSDLDDMMNRVPRQKMGVVRDPTNIKIADEKQRMDQEQTMQAKRIQQKLSELRKRNTKI